MTYRSAAPGHELTKPEHLSRHELHRDRIAQVYLGKISDSETQRRARERIDWIVGQAFGDHIFDVGCSEGITAIKLAQAGFNVDAVDINPETIEYARTLVEEIALDAQGKINLFVQDFFEIADFPEKYDTAVLGEVIEHVFEPKKMIERSVSSIKIGGRIIITTPWGFFPAPDHHQTFVLTNFLDCIPRELTCTHLSVTDGYIRFVATKTNPSSPVVQSSPTASLTDRLNDRALLEITEVAALKQQKTWFEYTSARNKLLEEARKRAVELMNKKNDLDRKYEAIATEQNQTYKRLLEAERALKETAFADDRFLRKMLCREMRKIKSFIKRISSQATIARLRHGHKLIKQKGFEATAKYYAAESARRFATTRLGIKIVRHTSFPRKVKGSRIFLRPVTPIGEEIIGALDSAAKQDFVILCNSFPGQGQTYGGEFIRTRYRAYLKFGQKGEVVQFSRHTNQQQIEKFEDTNQLIFRVSEGYCEKIVERIGAGRCKIFVHSPMPILQNVLHEKIIDQSRLTFWFHGFEVRDYRRLFFNYSIDEMAMQRARLNEFQGWRFAACKASFSKPEIKKIFVSEYLQNIAERDVSATACNSYIVPNFIDDVEFPFVEKTERSMARFLLIRSFDRQNYANDIAIEAIKILSSWDRFNNLHFTIRGFGRYFAEITKGVSRLRNVDVKEGYCSTSQISRLHADHGIFLCPTRFDTQGVTMCEAMSSGLVCITNSVAGIPEFIDDTCGILVTDNDPKAFADAMMKTQGSISNMLLLSKEAQARVRRKCGWHETIAKEMRIAFGKSP